MNETIRRALSLLGEYHGEEDEEMPPEEADTPESLGYQEVHRNRHFTVYEHPHGHVAVVDTRNGDYGHTSLRVAGSGGSHSYDSTFIGAHRGARKSYSYRVGETKPDRLPSTDGY